MFLFRLLLVGFCPAECILMHYVKADGWRKFFSAKPLWQRISDAPANLEHPDECKFILRIMIHALICIHGPRCSFLYYILLEGRNGFSKKVNMITLRGRKSPTRNKLHARAKRLKFYFDPSNDSIKEFYCQISKFLEKSVTAEELLFFGPP